MNRICMPFEMIPTTATPWYSVRWFLLAALGFLTTVLIALTARPEIIDLIAAARA